GPRAAGGPPPTPGWARRDCRAPRRPASARRSTRSGRRRRFPRPTSVQTPPGSPAAPAAETGRRATARTPRAGRTGIAALRSWVSRSAVIIPAATAGPEAHGPGAGVARPLQRELQLDCADLQDVAGFEGALLARVDP